MIVSLPQVRIIDGLFGLAGIMWQVSSSDELRIDVEWVPANRLVALAVRFQKTLHKDTGKQVDSVPVWQLGPELVDNVVCYTHHRWFCEMAVAASRRPPLVRDKYQLRALIDAAFNAAQHPGAFPAAAAPVLPEIYCLTGSHQLDPGLLTLRQFVATATGKAVDSVTTEDVEHAWHMAAVQIHNRVAHPADMAAAAGCKLSLGSGGSCNLYCNVRPLLGMTLDNPAARLLEIRKLISGTTRRELENMPKVVELWQTGVAQLATEANLLPVLAEGAQYSTSDIAVYQRKIKNDPAVLPQLYAEYTDAVLAYLPELRLSAKQQRRVRAVQEPDLVADLPWPDNFMDPRQPDPTLTALIKEVRNKVGLFGDGLTLVDMVNAIKYPQDPLYVSRTSRPMLFRFPGLPCDENLTFRSPSVMLNMFKAPAAVAEQFVPVEPKGSDVRKRKYSGLVRR